MSSEPAFAPEHVAAALNGAEARYGRPRDRADLAELDELHEDR